MLLFKGFGGRKGSWFGGESHRSVMMIENEMLLPSILENNSSACGDDDAASVIGLKSAAIGFMDQEFRWIIEMSL